MIPPAAHEGPNVSTFLAIFVILFLLLLAFFFFDSSHPKACEVISQCGFDLLMLLFLFCFVLFCLRKISPELTTANPPLFAEEAWPLANICAQLPLLYTWDTYHSMACQAVPCLHLESELANPGPPAPNMRT